MTGWTRPTTGDLSPLFVSGFGVWLASFGWLLVSSSNALVITSLGHPEWVPIFSCTVKVSVMFTQLVWLMPDSGLVGLAQLFGEVKATSRVREVVGLLQQVHLLLAGAAACAVIAFNPTFVARWVGAPLYAGLPVNLLFACGIVLFSLVHGLASAASVLGKRVEVGIVTLANGAVEVALAIGLGRWLGLPGIAAAGLIAASATSIPACAVLLRRAIGLSTWGLVAERIWPWTVRMAPIATAALLVAGLREWLGLWLTGTCTVLVLAAYVWHMRPLYGAVLALDPRWTRWLAIFKLAPPFDAAADASATRVALANRS